MIFSVLAKTRFYVLVRQSKILICFLNFLDLDILAICAVQCQDGLVRFYP